MDAQITLCKAVSASGMGQSAKNAAMKGAQTKPTKEVSASGMGQSKQKRNVAMKGAQTKHRKEESASSMEQRMRLQISEAHSTKGRSGSGGREFPTTSPLLNLWFLSAVGQVYGRAINSKSKVMDKK